MSAGPSWINNIDPSLPVPISGAINQTQTVVPGALFGTIAPQNYFPPENVDASASTGQDTFGPDALRNSLSGTIVEQQSWIGKILNGVKSAAKAQSAISILSNPVKLVTILLGLIAVAGGIYLFKPTQDIIIEPIKKAAKVAAETGE